jgi:hypothetical protein
MRRLRRFLLVGLGLSLLVVPTGASGVPYPTSGLVQVSDVSPFAACTADNVAAQEGTNHPNSEVEPWVDVNPTNPNNIVGIWQQDRWSDGGARGLVAGVSMNGGTTWTKVVIPKLSACSGNLTYDRATDPWLSFSPNGHLYAMSLSLSHDLRRSAMLVSKSTDGGLTWGDPTVLIDETSDFNLNDKNSLTADPTNSNFVYAVWDRSRLPSDRMNINALHSFAFRGDIIFTRTTNGGASWEPARAIFEPNANLFTIGNQIVVLPDGTLVDVFNLIRGAGLQPSPNQFSQAVIRSTDKGVTWSAPIPISSEQSLPVRDPETGQPVRAGTFLPDIAVNPSTGTLYVVWADGRFSGGVHNDIALSTSTDGGLTWSSPVKVNQTPTNVPAGNRQAFTPSVHVATDGTVAVTYYDFRNNTAAIDLPTHYWAVHCHGGCAAAANWGAETHIAGPFDMKEAPFARGFFLGDYVGLDNVGSTFTPLFTQTTAVDPANEYYAEVGP